MTEKLTYDQLHTRYLAVVWMEWLRNKGYFNWIPRKKDLPAR
jgi:hypothetical protein